MTVVEEADATASDAPPRFSWRGPTARTDRRVLVGLVGFIAFWFTLPALLGHPLVPDDDLFQNVPLRILSGDLIAGGHFPLWNRWMWSGTPLLGGLNAGALYPGTFLFAAFPPVAAWVLNEIFAYAVCAVGLYLLLRDHRLVPVAAAIGSATFTFAGFMPAQLRHFGLVQGMSFVPWMLLALEHLVRSGEDESTAGEDGSGRDARSVFEARLRWVIVLAVAGGMILLTGEPRAWSNAATAVGLYLVVLVWQHPTGRRRLLTAVAVAVPVILALGAVQLLPGVHFVGQSQRGDPSYSFFSSGSLPPYALAFQVVPYLIGGYADLHLMPSYAGGRPHLPEISGYAGLLPLVALFTFVWWRRLASKRSYAWLVMVVVGLVLALGSFTPLGPVLSAIPLYGGQRTQARNLAVVDLGLAGLVACWVHVLVTRARTGAGVLVARLERSVALVPSLLAVALVVPAWIFREDYQRFFQVPTIHPSQFGHLLWYFIAVLILAGLVGAFLIARPRLSRRHLVWALVAVVVLDLGLALLDQGLGPFSSHALDRSSAQTEPIAAKLAPGERIAVYDPERRFTVYADEKGRAFSFDLTMLHGLPAVQGYGSVVDGTYDAATNTHPRQTILPRVLGSQLADELNLRFVLVPPSYLDPSAPGPEGEDPVAVDPALVAALVPPRWEPAGRASGFLIFANTQVKGRAWVVAPGASTSDQSGSATVTVQRTDEQDGEVDRVMSAQPALLVRSVAYDDGWTARVKGGSGTHDVTVIRRGLVQAVAVPAGTSEVTWSYHPAGFRLGLALTLVSTLPLIVVAVVLGARTLRRRRVPEETNA